MQVSLVLLGAKPEEVSTWHAFPNSPSLASQMDVRTFLSLSLHCMGVSNIGGGLANCTLPKKPI